MVEPQQGQKQPEPSKHEPGKHPNEPHQPHDPSRPGQQPPQPSQPGQPKPRGEGEEPETEEEKQTRTVQMTSAQFETLIKAVIGEARKPVTDEQMLARKKKWRDRNVALMRSQRLVKLNSFRNCNHMQFPGSVLTGCSVVAWATQSDHKRRGVCQHCGTIFSSVREECLSEEIFDAYKMLIRMPTHPGGNINTIFQSA